MTRKTLTAALAAAMIGTASLTVPATAGGQISINLAPANAEQEQAMRVGLGMYALFHGIQNGGITQNGSGNAAGLMQNGSGNLGVVHQEGSGHNGTLQQNGNGNACGLFQFGQNTNGHVQQNGNGGTCATLQFGW
ncbi:MAG: curlin [Rhizobiaceae bacterium]|nr:curlin [Rhizobiaceae bacterium]